MPKLWQNVKETVKCLPLIGRLAQKVNRVFRKENFVSDEVKKQLRIGVDYIYAADVEGDIAEFGTCSGETAAAIARAMSAWISHPSAKSKRFHLFDSFQGFPDIDSKIDKECPHVKSGDWHAGLCKGLSKDELADRLGSYLPRESLFIYDGWYKDTVPQLKTDTRFALLHIDCDLYASTMDALDPLFSRGRVAEGAVIFFDAWNCNRASPAYGQRKAWSDLTQKHSIVFSDGGDYSWEGHKLIVHSYQTSILPPRPTNTHRR